MTRAGKLRPYAYDTKVPVQDSRAEIERLLTKHGAHQIGIMTDTRSRTGMVAFTIQGRQYRLPVPKREQGKRKPEQIERESWRALLLLTKARLEYISAGMSDFETEFLAHLVLPSGTTVKAETDDRIAQMYSTGTPIPLLPEGV